LASQINASNSGFGGIVSTGDSSGVLQLQTVGTTAITVDTSQNTTLAGKLTTASSGIQFSDASIQTAAASPYVLKNRIINGDMRIDQRNAGASVTPANGAYTLDRWAAYQSVASKFSLQQSTTAPSGFTNSLKVTSLSAYSVGAADYYLVAQNIEGFNIADLAWGTASAKTVTLSFQVYSSLTGTFGGSLANSSNARSYPFTYTISTANTWTTISVTIAGDTTGTWETGNGIGFKVYIGLGVGSTYSGAAGSWSGSNFLSATGATSVVGTNGATWYITGVQLEQNTSATPFERRLYGQELLLCQRYYEKSYDYSVVPGTASNNSSCAVIFSSQSGAFQGLKFQVVKRATPTITGYSYFTGAINNWTVASVGDGAVTFGNIGLTGLRFVQVVGSSATFNWGEGHYTASAEL
jgi:hypothetical protein